MVIIKQEGLPNQGVGRMVSAAGEMASSPPPVPSPAPPPPPTAPLPAPPPHHLCATTPPPHTVSPQTETGDDAFTSAVDDVCECKAHESASDPSPSWYAAAENDFQTYRQHKGTDEARDIRSYAIIKPIAQKIFSDPRAFEMYAACSKKSANAGADKHDQKGNRGKCHKLVLDL